MKDIKRLYTSYRKRVDTILESFTDGFFEVYRTWTVTYWNRTAEELLQIPKEEVVGKNLWDVFPEAVGSRFYTEYHKAMSLQIATRFEERFHSKKMWFEVSVFPNGEGLSIYFKDITHRKNTALELEHERKKYRDLFNHNPLPQWVYDAETLMFLDVNEAAVRHYGYSKKEFLNASILSIRPEEDISEIKRILNDIRNCKKPRTSSVRHRKKNGEIIYADVKGTAIIFNGRVARMVVVVDKTAEINAELAKQQSLAKLHEITWIQAHEVRRPLSNILGLGSLLEVDISSDQQHTLIQKLLEQAKELDQVIIKTLNNTSN
jgi:PAS domain S-box-containing protein